jgi:transposase
MEVIVDRCAGLDVHKDQVTACVRGWGEGRRRRSQTRVFLTFEGSLRELRDWLAAEEVSVVAMEATGVYWKPIWYMLEDAGFELLLVNPQHVKAVSGRKTDVRDAAWLGQLLECGLLIPSFVPPRAVRELRDVTRYRRRLVEDRTRELLRLQKLLEDAQVKLGSVVSDISGVTARSILDALCAGERDPETLASLAVGRLKAKIPQLRQAVPGRFNAHHAVLVGELLGHLDYLRAAIGRLDAQVDELMRPFSAQRDRLMTAPGVKKTTAEIVIAEIGVDMARFPSAAQLAAWAGVCPGNHESAGKRRNARTRDGNPWLQSALVEAAWAASRTRGTSFQARFWRIAKRRGREKATMAVAHHLLIVIWHLLTHGTTYQELGVDYLERRDDPARRQRHLVHQLEQLGLKVTLEPATAA